MQQAIEELKKALEHLVNAREELEKEPSSWPRYNAKWNVIYGANYARLALKLLAEEKEE